MTITDKLADALRALYALVPFNGNHEDEALKGPKLKAARQALAEYDAQQACAATEGGKWWRGGDRTCGPNAATFRFIRDDSGIVAYVEGSREQAEERAARIVQCVNAHDGLVSALQACQRVLDDNGGTTPQQWIDAEAAARAALASTGVSNA